MLGAATSVLHHEVPHITTNQSLAQLLSPLDNYNESQRATDQFLIEYDPAEDDTERRILADDDSSFDEEAEDDFFALNNIPLTQFDSEEVWEKCLNEAMRMKKNQ